MSLKHYKIVEFKFKSSNQNWDTVLTCFYVGTKIGPILDQNLCWDCFKTIFHSVFDIVAPLKKENIETKNYTLDELGYFRKH